MGWVQGIALHVWGEKKIIKLTLTIGQKVLHSTHCIQCVGQMMLHSTVQCGVMYCAALGYSGLAQIYLNLCIYLPYIDTWS